jgi:hypothetical protein
LRWSEIQIPKYARRRRRNYAEDAEKKYESETALMSTDVDDLDALKLAWFFLRLLRNFCAFCVHISSDQTTASVSPQTPA